MEHHHHHHQPTKFSSFERFFVLLCCLLHISLSFFIYHRYIQHFTDFCTEPSLAFGANHRQFKEQLATEDLTAPSEQDLTWFIQVSDIHISSLGRGEGANNMQYILQHIIPTVKPLFVLATGDLTDASDPLFFGYQEPAEWGKYKQLLVDAGLWDKDLGFWIDIRGNHDCYDVPSVEDARNLFSSFSVTQEYDFARVVKKDNLQIGIVAFDACPKVGFNRFLNFVGYLLPQDLETLKNNIALVKGSDFVVGIGHYPLSILQVPSNRGIKEITSNFSVYLCGHLHRLAGDELRTVHDNGMGEFEIPDLKTGAFFRIMSVDHGLFSFRDFLIQDYTQEKQPLMLLVTNPKDARYHIQSASGENLAFSIASENIRILLFGVEDEAAAASLSMNVYIDEQLYGKAEKAHDSKVLWKLAWNPARNYAKGLHSIRVEVVSDKSAQVVAREAFNFSVDGSSAARSWNILHAPFGKWFKISAFAIQFVLLGFFLLFSQVFVQHKAIYYFSLAFVLSHNILPDSIGCFVPSSGKMYFTYYFGVFDSSQQFFPVLDSYIYYCFYMLAIYIPSISCLVSCISPRKGSFFNAGRTLWFVWCILYFSLMVYNSSMHYLLSPKVVCAAVYAVYGMRNRCSTGKCTEINKKKVD